MNSIDQSISFKGFSQHTLDFLLINSQKNSKRWFEEHRNEFEEHVLLPFRALSDSISQTIADIDGEIESRSHRTVSRIYRDTRFSSDKSLYKKTLWITFKRPVKNWTDFPGFFFELSPDFYRYGMGFFSASKETMDGIRLLVDENPELLTKQFSVLEKLKGFVIEGTEYKRIINPLVSKDLLSLYQKKNIYFVKNFPVNKALFSKTLASEISDSFSKLAQLYYFLIDVKRGTKTRNS